MYDDGCDEGKGSSMTKFDCSKKNEFTREKMYCRLRWHTFSYKKANNKQAMRVCVCVHKLHFFLFIVPHGRHEENIR